jgi:plasmid stabilization system protein ParE
LTRFRVEFSPEARGHVRLVAAWWAANRLKAPALFRDELAAAVRLLRAMPSAGTLYNGVRDLELRRVPMSRSRYHVYYSVDAAASRVRVHAVWHMARGQGPPL